VWKAVNAEYLYFLAPGRVHVLIMDKFSTWSDDVVIRRMGQLDDHLMANWTQGQDMLAMFQNIRKAHDVFPWAVVVNGVIRRGAQTRAGRKAQVQLDSSTEYGSILSYPCRCFDFRPACVDGLDSEDSPAAAVGVGRGGFVRRDARETSGPSRRGASSIHRGSLPLVRETHVASSAGVRRW